VPALLEAVWQYVVGRSDEAGDAGSRPVILTPRE